jgi:NADPH-dependent 2,4-dienoyl-CoA reductase/sulfur reductase-like enzyme
VGNGVVVNAYQQTSHHDIYAAGDNAWFPYRALGKEMRIEHWDHAVNHGKQAGRNLAGAGEPYDYLPYFYSDLFRFGYEAVGEVDSRLETFADWQEENRTGVIYYLQEGRVRGVMMCNVWEKVEAARELIKSGGQVGQGDLRRAIR